MTTRPQETIFALIVQALRLGSEHLRQTLTLARIETTGNIRAILGLITLAGTAVLFVIVSVFLVLGAIVKALAAVVGSEALAASIVASPFAIASLAMLWIGLRWMAPENLEPKRTERQMAKDARAMLGRAPRG